MNTTTADTVKRSKGIDVSQLNGIVDWHKVREDGYEFAFVKATEGGDHGDPLFKSNRRNARFAGIHVGYCHVFRPSDSVEQQVASFVRAVGILEQDALAPVLICEETGWEKFGVAERVQMIVEFCSKVKRILGSAPTLSGSESFFSGTLGNAPELGIFDLCISNYGVEEPTVPKPWTNWHYWRFSGSGKVAGTNGDVQVSCFNGSDIARARHRRDENANEEPVSPIAEYIWWACVGLYFVGLFAVLLERILK